MLGFRGVLYSFFVVYRVRLAASLFIMVLGTAFFGIQGLLLSLCAILGFYFSSASLAAILDESPLLRVLWRLAFFDYWLGAKWFGVVLTVVCFVMRFPPWLVAFTAGHLLGSMYFILVVEPASLMLDKYIDTFRAWFH